MRAPSSAPAPSAQRGPGARPPNFLTGSPLDRREDLRDEPGAFDRLVRDGVHMVVPVRGSDSLVHGDDPVEATLVEGDDARRLLTSDRIVALLGEAQGRLHWVADVDKAAGDRLASRHRARFTNLRAVSTLLPPGAAAVLVHARALAHFHRTHRWCGRCGHATDSAGLGHWRRCLDEGCGHTWFPRSDPAIIVRVAQDERVLLIRQPEWPERQFATVAGFVEPGESLEEAVAREIREETGLVATEVAYHSSQPWPFPTSIMLGFDAEVVGDLRLDSDEVAEACWYTRDELRAARAEGSIRLPAEFSISRRLVEDWLASER